MQPPNNLGPTESLENPTSPDTPQAPLKQGRKQGLWNTRNAYGSHRNLLIVVAVVAILFLGYGGWQLAKSSNNNQEDNSSTPQKTDVILPSKSQILSINSQLQVANSSTFSGNLTVNGTLRLNGNIVSAQGAQFAGSVIASNINATNITGSGTGITGVNAGSLVGTINNSQLSSTVTLQGNSFNAANELVQLNANDALPAIDGSQLTNVDAAEFNGLPASYYQDATNITSGTLSDSRLNSDVALTDAANTFAADNIFSSSVTVQGTLDGSSAVYADNVSALSFTQNGYMVCDSSGNCGTGGGSGGVAGTGTAGDIAMFNTAGSIGNSIISQSGTTVTVSGTLSATALQGDGSAITNVDATELNSEPASFYADASNLTSGDLGVAYGGTGLDGATATNGQLLIGNSTNSDFSLGTLSQGTGISVTNGPGTITVGVNSSVCLTSGNCSGVGGGVTTSGGTTDYIPLFTGSQAINDSILSQTGTTVTVAGTLSATDLQGNGSAVTNLNVTNVSSGTLGVAYGGTGANTFSTGGILYGNGTGAVGSVAGTTGECLTAVTGSAPVWESCTSASSGSTPGGTASGDLAGNYPNPRVVGLDSTPLSISSLNTDNILIYNGTDWVNESLSGPLAVATNGAVTIGSKVITNGNLANSSLSVDAGTGLDDGGSVDLGGSTSLSVAYGSVAGSSVQGNTTLICPSGSGNLEGGGTTITLGAGGTCAALETVPSPSFTSETLSTALAVSSGGTGASTFTTDGIVFGNGTGQLGVTAAGTTGDCLVATSDGAPTWESCTAASGGTTPSGPASGDLSGNYPDPTVSGLDKTPLSISGLSSTNILIYNGTDWVNESLSGALTVSSTGVASLGDGVVTNANLLGGTYSNITGTGSLTSGSIASGFGSILTTNSVQGGSITSTSSITAGTTTAAGSLVLQDGSNHPVTITSTTQSNTLALSVPADPHATDEICLETLGNCTGASSSGDGSYIENQLGEQSGADFNISGSGTAASFNATGAGGLELNGSSINNAGVLSNVAYLDQANTFADANTFNAAVTLQQGATVSNNQTLSVGTSGTPTGQLYVSGGVPSTAVSGTSVFAASDGLADEGNYVYATGNPQLAAIDIADPTNISGISSVRNSDGNASEIAASGNYVYSVQGNGDFSIFNISQPGNLAFTKDITVSGANNLSGVAVSGNYLYLDNGANSGELYIYNIANPTNPTLEGSIELNNTTGGNFNNNIAVSGQYAYVTEPGANDVQIIDVSSPSDPTVTATISVGSGTTPNGIFVSDGLAYITEWGTGILAIYRVNDPASSPYFEGSISTGSDSQPTNLTVQGQYAYVANSNANDIGIYDISNPSSPTAVGTMPTGSGSTPVNVVIVGNYLYELNFNSNSLEDFNLGGTYTQTLQAGSTETGNLQVDDNANISGDESVDSGLTVGGSTDLEGDLGVSGNIDATGSVNLQNATNSAAAFQVQNASGTTLLGINTSSSEINVNANMTISGVTVAGQTPEVVQQAASPAITANTATATFTNNTAVGDTVVAFVAVGPAGVESLAGGGVSAWHKALSQTTLNGSYLEVWYGTVTSSGSDAVTATVNSGATSPNTLDIEEVSGLISSPLDQVAGSSINTATTSPSTPTITTTSPNEIVFGFALNANGTGYSAPSSGYTAIGAQTYAGYTALAYQVTSSDGSYGVSWTDSGAADTYATATVSFKAVGSQPDILDAVSDSGATVASVSASGSTTFKNATDSTAAFQVQNTAGQSVLTVDTSNMRVDIGTTGTPTGQLYVSGSVASSATGSVAIPNTDGDVTDYTVQGDYAYVLEQNGSELGVYDVTNPADPVSISTFTNSELQWGTFGQSVVASGHYLYITTMSADPGYAGGDLLVIDISNPYSPTMVGYVNANNSANWGNMAVDGSYLYAEDTSDNYLDVFNVANPSAPVLVDQVSDGGYNFLAIQGRYLYESNYNPVGFSVYDLGNPASPVLAGSTSSLSLRPQQVVVSGSYAYVVGYEGNLMVINVANPAAPTEVANVGLPGYASAISLEGKYVYVSGVNDGDLYTVDISNPTSPTVVSNTPINNTAGAKVQVVGRYGYEIDADSNLDIFNLGGTYTQTLQAGSAETSSLQVDSDANISGNESVTGGLTVGGSTNLEGNLGVSGSVDLQNATNSPAAFQVQNASGDTLLGINTTSSEVNVNANMTISGVTVAGETAAIAQQADGTGGAGSAAVTFDSNTTVGNTIVVYVEVDTSSSGDGVGSITGGGVSSWNKISAGSATGETDLEAWYGEVTSSGSNAITVTEAGSLNTTVRALAVELSGLSSTPLDTAAAVYTSTPTSTPTTPQITTTGSDDMVLAFNVVSGDTNYADYTSPSNGFSALSSPSLWDAGAYDADVAPGTYSTSWTDTGNTGTYETSIIALQSLSSQPNILNVVSNSGSAVASVSASGSTTFQNATDSTAAFQVQNAAGQSVLTVDTSNMRVDIGTTGTPTGQLYVSGAASTTSLAATTVASNTGSQGMGVSGNYAFTINSNVLDVYDISNLNSPVKINQTTLPSRYTGSQGVALPIYDNYLYMSTNSGTGGSGFDVINITNPNDPVYVDTVGAVQSDQLLLADSYLYDVDSNGELTIWSLANPASPKQVSSIANGTIGEGSGVAVSGDYLYVETNNSSSASLVTYNVSNPVSPTETSSITLMGTIAENIEVVGNYIYAQTANANADQIFNISQNPAQPVSVSSSGVANIEGLTSQGQTAYAQFSATYGAYNVANQASWQSDYVLPTTLSNGATYSATDSPLFVEGRYAIGFVSDSSNNYLATFDLGGTDTQSLQAGSTETGSLQVDNSANISGDANISGGLTVEGNTELQGSVGANGLTVSATNLQSVVIGNTQYVEPWPGGMGNLIMANAFTTGSTATTVSYLNVYMSSVASIPNNQYQMAIYSDSSGAPDTLLASTSIGSLTPYAWNSIAIPATTLAANTNYWIAFNTNNQANLPAAGTGSNGGNYQGSTFGSFPASYGSGNGYGASMEVAASTSPIAATQPFFQVQNASGADLAAANVATNSLGVSAMNAPTNVYATSSAPAPTVTNVGANDGESFSYEVATVDANGFVGAVSPIGSTSSGPDSADFGSTNYNEVTLGNANGYGANCYDVYRTVNGANSSQTGLIAKCVTGTFDDENDPVLSSGYPAPTTGLAANTNYYYEITAVDANGGETTPSQEAHTNTGTDNTAIGLSWNAVVGAKAYNIYRSTNSGSEELLTQVTTNTYIDTGSAPTDNAVTTPPTINMGFTDEFGGSEGGQLTVGNIGTSEGQLYVSGDVATGPTGYIVPAPYEGNSFNQSAGTVVSGNYEYAIDGFSGQGQLQVYDISNPSDPTLVTTVTSVNFSYQHDSLAISGNYLYIGSNDAINVLSIADPAAPVFLGYITTTAPINDISSLTTQGDYLFATEYVYSTNASYIQAFSISNPAALTPLAPAYALGDTNGFNGSGQTIAIENGYAYIVTEDAMYVIDVSDPASPTIVSQTLAGSGNGTFGSIAVEGADAYIGMQNDGNTADGSLAIYNISNPADPTLMANGGPDVNAGVDDIVVAGNYAYEAISDGSKVAVMNIANPNAPVLLGYIPTNGNPAQIAVQGRYLYTAEAGGLGIYDLGGTYTQALQAGSTETTSLQVDSDATVSGNESVTSDLTVGQNANIEGSLGVGGSVNVTSNSNTQNVPALTLQNAGSGDAIMQYTNNTGGYYVGVDSANNGDFTIGTVTGASDSSTTNVGNTTEGGATNDANSYINGIEVTTGATAGSSASISFYVTSVDNTNPDVQVAVYGISGATYPLLASSSSYTVTHTGWNTVPITANLTANTSYLIALNAQGNTGFAQATSGSGGFDTNADGETYGYWPTSYSGINTGGYEFSMYLTYTSGSQTNDFSNAPLTISQTGQTTFKSVANSTTAFQVQSESGSDVLDADTTDGYVGIDTNTPANLLSIGALTTAAGTYQIAVSTGSATNSGIVVQTVAGQSSGYILQAQSSSGSTLASIDYQGDLMVQSATVNGSLTLNGHLVTGNIAGGTTTAAAQSGAGSGSACSVTGDDTSGQITLTTGTGSWASGAQCVITFASSYTGQTHPVISSSSSTSTATVSPYVTSGTSSFTINFINADNAQNTYTWNYFNAQ